MVFILPYSRSFLVHRLMNDVRKWLLAGREAEWMVRMGTADVRGRRTTRGCGEESFSREEKDSVSESAWTRERSNGVGFGCSNGK